MKYYIYDIKIKFEYVVYKSVVFSQDSVYGACVANDNCNIALGNICCDISAKNCIYLFHPCFKLLLMLKLLMIPELSTTQL